jgi:predicted negative regulator of RcsB-dependent stress response
VAIAQGKKRLDQRAAEWFQNNRRTAIGVGVALAVVIGGGLFWWTARERRELFAERALTAARSSADAGNLPLASSDLARMVSTYSGTRAAQEATLLLAQVRLLQNQPALAVGDLRKFISSGPRPEFRGPANGLLAAALEEAAQPGDAAKAYETAAAETPYKGVKGQYLLDAARSYVAAGDTAQAARIYERVATEFKDLGGSAMEAQVRLAELRKTAPKPS